MDGHPVARRGLIGEPSTIDLPHYSLWQGIGQNQLAVTRDKWNTIDEQLTRVNTDDSSPTDTATVEYG